MWKTICTGDIESSYQLSVISYQLKKADNLQPAARNKLHSVYSRNHFLRFLLFVFLCIALIVPVSGYAASYRAYCKDIRHGKEAIKAGDYSAARRSFEEAFNNGKSLDALMYIAIIDYRTNNLDNAERLIREAELMGGFNYHYLRVLGYKALILLKKNRDQGLEALDRYVVFYSRIDPLMSINDVKAMVTTGDIDMARLDKLIEEQATWYENDVEQYWSTGTGWYADKWGGIAPIPNRPDCNP
jgi:hypothetical protein